MRSWFIHTLIHCLKRKGGWDYGKTSGHINRGSSIDNDAAGLCGAVDGGGRMTTGVIRS